MLSDRQIQATKPTTRDQWLTDDQLPHGHGTLQLRIRASGERSFWYRYTAPGRRQIRIPIGPYARTETPGFLTLAQARAEAGRLAALYREHPELREHLERVKAARVEKRAEAERERAEAAARAARGSLRALLAGYVSHLERAGKMSAADVSSIFMLHVLTPFPGLADKPAADVTPTELRDVLARLIEAGKGRTAGKLRSFLQAAYAQALRAELDPAAPASLLGFAVQANPAAVLPALSQFSVPGERALSVPELRAYLLALDALPVGMTRAALLLLLYLGGQRGAQMLRARPADVDMHARTITLRDPKGRRQHARVHVLPLVEPAAEIVQWLLAANGAAPWLFTTDGKNATRQETLSAAVKILSDKLLADGAITAPFKFGDIRRTCETQQAACGISREIRAQIQSHGLGGVQTRHYDRHDYMMEKRAEMEKWRQRLSDIWAGTAVGGMVVQLKRSVG